MLKFRMTNSMKARRAAEAQRKALEEKLKMEWAWKPMAAVMNEKQSDLVYWVPPLYTSNLLTSFSSCSSSVSSSLTSSPSSSFRRSSFKLPPSSLSQGSPVRKRKLAQRRPKLSPEQSIQEAEDEVSDRGLRDDERRKRDDATTDEDRESGIQDEFQDSSVDEEGPFDQTLNRTNYLKYNLKNLEKQKKLSKKREKIRHIPTVLKVINKLSHIYTLPVNPPPPMYGSAKPQRPQRPQRPKEFRTSSTRKPKRPSVKIYRVPSQRASLKKAKEEENQPFYVITKNKAPFSNLQQQQRASIRSKDSDRTHIGLPTLSENDLRNAHLEMILKILANLYEEKITHQDTELQHLKSKMQLQEKVLKQTAQLVLDVKDQMRTMQAKLDFNEELKKFYKRKTIDAEPSFPYHPLEPLMEESNESQRSQLSLSVVDADDASSENPSEIKDEICESQTESKNLEEGRGKEGEEEEEEEEDEEEDEEEQVEEKEVKEKEENKEEGESEEKRNCDKKEKEKMERREKEEEDHVIENDAKEEEIQNEGNIMTFSLKISET